MKRLLRNLILGKDNFLSDHSRYRLALLLGQLSVLSCGIAFFYVGVEIKRQNYVGTLPMLAIVLISIIAFFLNREKKYDAAIFMLLIMANISVFYYSFYGSNAVVINAPFYIVNTFGSFVLFRYERRKLAITFALIGFILFLIGFIWGPVNLPEEDKLYFLVNILFVHLVCTIIIYFTLRLNHHSERLTTEKNVQLQKVNAELDRFVYSASHDLRAPLSSMLGLIELAQKSTDFAEIDAYLSMMKGRVHHLDEFIREIIDFSRNQRLEVITQPVNLYYLIEEARVHLKYLEGAEKIRFNNMVSPEQILNTDSMRLKIVLNNLMNNAIKYHDPMKEDRYIAISCRALPIGLEIKVADNGIGIAQEHHDKVFNMFYRASDKSKGSGLGLYIVKESLEQLGGHVAIDSRLDEGTTFTISLPPQR